MSEETEKEKISKIKTDTVREPTHNFQNTEKHVEMKKNEQFGIQENILEKQNFNIDSTPHQNKNLTTDEIQIEIEHELENSENFDTNKINQEKIIVATEQQQPQHFGTGSNDKSQNKNLNHSNKLILNENSELSLENQEDFSSYSDKSMKNNSSEENSDKQNFSDFEDISPESEENNENKHNSSSASSFSSSSDSESDNHKKESFSIINPEQNAQKENEEEEEPWEQRIVSEIQSLKEIVDQKAEKSVVDQISRYQDEIFNLRKSNSERVDLVEKNTTDPEIICHDCIENGDIESAFLTILRYVETISATKAESILVEDKASKVYVDSLFNRLNVITRQQITEANAKLKDKLEARLNSMVNEFDQFSAAVEKRMRYCEMEIIKLEDIIDNARLVTKKSITGTYYHSPVTVLTEKQTPAPRKMFHQIPKTQPMRAIVRKGEQNPDFLLASTPINSSSLI